MKLAEFITETLGEIMQGVSAAIKAHNVAALGGVINPRSAAEESDPKTLPMSPVEFDVAVTVESSLATRKSGGGSIKVVEAKVSKDSSEKTVDASRVKFSVPLSLPTTRLVD
jgi:hypothetical protein